MMDKKRILLKRLLTIYILFFVVIALSLLNYVIPEMGRGFRGSEMISNEIATAIVEGESVKHYMLLDIPIKEYDTKLVCTSDGADGKGIVNLEGYASKMDLIVEQVDSEESSPMSIAFGAVGGNAWYYVVAWIISFAYIAIVILLALIINSLRLSIKNNQEVSNRNVLFTRVVALLVIVTELLDATTTYFMKLRASELLEGSAFCVDTTFLPNYWVIILGVVVLFMAEVFAISHAISEEQKLTI